MAKQKMKEIEAVDGFMFDGKLLEAGQVVAVEATEADRLLKKPRLFRLPTKPVAKPEPSKSEAVE